MLLLVVLAAALSFVVAERVQCAAAKPPRWGGPVVDVVVSGSGSGQNRTFSLRLPQHRPTGGEQLSMVMAVHGAFQTAAQFMASTGIDAAATSAGFVFAAPHARNAALCNCSVWGGTLTRLDPGLFIAAVAPDGALQFNGSELPFIDAAFACIADLLHVPLSGDVYAAAFSQGAKVATQLACTPGPRFAVRAAVVYGPVFVDVDHPTCGAGPVRLLVLASKEDTATPFCSGLGLLGPDAPFLSTWAHSISRCTHTLPPDQAWCSPPNSPGGFHALNAFSWVSGCDKEVSVLYISNGVERSGHSWPGVMPELGGRDANAVMLQFFRGASMSAIVAGSSLRACNATAAWPCH
jgi:poly(3-hydroxybutyrate) depolymerase